ncbi:hypothetical protein K504DRAFT_385790 [Pleomassaria siparia CBS 279.74]|uniref:Heterokaryon incompatibility domain-containing protein n=1 Tax=Pleomassaria siparia CBS 279.74 TaxID=1314801 RepID=A0A6G1K120_9PLEO|nr:hypothetical protein K504DRAFT_385790 [Pleomassaria siparia CBS 279.74]
MPSCHYQQDAERLTRLGHAEFIEIDTEDLDIDGLYAHVLSPQARRMLLDGSAPTTATHTDNAETLLQDLTRLSPSAAKCFTPKATTTDHLTFRLINDRDGRWEGEEKSYIAMSYCWKQANHQVPRTERSELGDLPFGWLKTVERFPLPVGEAMFQAVLRERKHGEGVWFDQVCINQEDEVEKATTIGAIDIIYSHARTVVIALDDISIPDGEASFLQHYLDQYSYSDLPYDQQPNIGLNPPLMQQQPLLQSFFDRILSSVWFERAWCAHEMRLGRSHIFLVPCESDEDDESFAFIRFTRAFFLHILFLASELPSSSSTKHRRLRTLLELFTRRSIQDKRSAIKFPSSGAKFSPIPNSVSIVPLIADIFKMSAGGNPRLPAYQRRLDANRDRISIALNDAGLPLVLNPASPLQRPSIEDECLRQLLLVGLAARDPVTLCTTGTPLQLHDGSISWLCRPTCLDLTSWHQSLLRFPSNLTPITQGSDGRAEYVQLELLFLDLPHRTQPNRMFPTHVQRARAIIELCMQYQLPSSPAMWNNWQKNGQANARATGTQNIFVQTLACFFECGPNWILDVYRSLQPSSSPHQQLQMQGLTTQMVETLCNPHMIIQNYIRMDEGRMAITLLIELLGIVITRGIPWASGATERTHGPLITSLPTPDTSSSTYDASNSNSNSNSASPTHSYTHPYQHQQTYSPHGQQSYTPISPTLASPPKALIFAPFTHSKTLLVAVPDAVKSSNCSDLARAWILAPMSGYTASPRQVVSWTLRNKSVLFGGMAFSGGLEREGEKRLHRVFGAGH